MTAQLGIFDDILDLEEKFYDKGFQQGLVDGVQAGRIEGRTFGLEKGFEKFSESARLHGRSIVWANRIPQQALPLSSSLGSGSRQASEGATLALPSLPANVRLTKHVKTLYALAESESLSTENTEEAVSDFDDRLKRAQAKARIIEKMAGEASVGVDSQGTSILINNANIEDLKVARLSS